MRRSHREQQALAISQAITHAGRTFGTGDMLSQGEMEIRKQHARRLGGDVHVQV